MCIVDVFADERPSLLSESIVTARKIHQCGECGMWIVRGEQYESASGKWDGEFYTMKTCMVCLELRNQFCCSWTYGEVLEDIRESLYQMGDVDLGCLDGLSPQAVSVMAEMIEDLWEEEMPR